MPPTLSFLALVAVPSSPVVSVSTTVPSSSAMLNSAPASTVCPAASVLTTCSSTGLSVAAMVRPSPLTSTEPLATVLLVLETLPCSSTVKVKAPVNLL